jgi:hypothetical protein
MSGTRISGCFIFLFLMIHAIKHACNNIHFVSTEINELRKKKSLS